jgi:hypothetical protein
MPPFLNRKQFLLGLSGVVLASCGGNSSSPDASKTPVRTFKMGERAAAGTLTYNVLEAEYRTQIGSATAPRIPEKRFLVLRLAITNGGGKEAELPMFHLVDAAGESYPEVQNGEGVAGWFGILRKIAPTSTDEGRILFDVTPRDYKLEVTDGAETGKEILAHIEIPMQFDTTEPIPAAGQGSLPATSGRP